MGRPYRRVTPCASRGPSRYDWNRRITSASKLTQKYLKLGKVHGQSNIPQRLRVPEYSNFRAIEFRQLHDLVSSLCHYKNIHIYIVYKIVKRLAISTFGGWR